MGKVKSRKQSNRQLIDPIPHVEKEEDAALEDHSSNSFYVQKIVEQLQSHLVEERDSGLNSLSVACQNRCLIDNIIAHDVVRTAGALLVDPSAIVRHSAAGSLRNMSSLSSEICDLMVNQDVMTPLVTLLKQKYQEPWSPQKASEINRIDTFTDTFVEAVNLLWNLCESSDIALKILNQEQLVMLLFKCLNVEIYGIKVAITVAQCLNAVTDGNLDGIHDPSEFELTMQKIITVENEGLKHWYYLQTLAISILLNLKKGHISQFSPSCTAIAIKNLCSVLNIDHISEINKYSSDVPIRTLNGMVQVNRVMSEDSHPKDEIDAKKLGALDMSLDNVHTILSAQILSLEILSNIMFSEDDDTDSYDDDCSEESTQDFNVEIDGCNVDIEMENMHHNLPTEVLEGIISQQIVDKVISKFRLPPVNVMQIIRENKEYNGKIIEKLTQLRCTSFLCFQNLVAALDFSDLGGFSQMKNMWISLGTILVLETESKNNDILEALTSAMRALMQKWVDEKCSEVIESCSSSDLNIFYDVYKSVSVAKIHINLIKTIGGMGVLMANKGVGSKVPEAELLLGQVGDFLMDCIGTPTERGKLWIVAEALDTLFDVFAEDDYNHVMKSLGIIEKLKGFLPQFKKQIQNQRRELGDNKVIIQTAKTNLLRFIEYKVKHGAA